MNFRIILYLLRGWTNIVGTLAKHCDSFELGMRGQVSWATRLRHLCNLRRLNSCFGVSISLCIEWG